jgi:hypothetical protein|mmetsp:Transcript_29423/g.52623  ORF Transcript_29423/g.52623 Transcript_29423/m.52623 type:complete len:180 (-) Transcript_29423:2205-2744(-)
MAAIRPNRLAAVLVLLVVLCAPPAAISTEEGEAEAKELPNFKKMKVKVRWGHEKVDITMHGVFSGSHYGILPRVQELRALLEERGVECRGCAEKSDLVARVEETYHLPLKPKTEWKDPTAGTADGGEADKPDMDDPEIQELLKNLQHQMKGQGGFKMFNGKDFANMKPEDIEKKFNGEL